MTFTSLTLEGDWAITFQERSGLEGSWRAESSGSDSLRLLEKSLLSIISPILTSLAFLLKSP